MARRPQTSAPIDLPACALSQPQPSLTLSLSHPNLRESLTNKKFRAALMDVITAADVAGGCEKGVGQLLYVTASKVRETWWGEGEQVERGGGISVLPALSPRVGRAFAASHTRHGARRGLWAALCVSKRARACACVRGPARKGKERGDGAPPPPPVPQPFPSLSLSLSSSRPTPCPTDPPC